MEVEPPVLAPQQAVSPSPVKKPAAAASGSVPKARAARRKTLCDITNLRMGAPAEEPDESACPAAAAAAPAAGAGADAAEGFAQLAKENADLVRRLEERDEIIQLCGTEIEKLRLSNWELARTNTQMMAELNQVTLQRHNDSRVGISPPSEPDELNNGRNRLKALQHELACSRAALKAKTSELEDAKKAVLRRNAPAQEKTANQRPQQLGPDRAAQKKDGDAADPEPASDASRAGSVQRPGNASRKRMLRSRSLGPATSIKLAAPKEKETSQRRKSMRIPPPSGGRAEDLFEIEDVQRAIGSCKIDPESESGSERPGHPFLRRSSLGRPLRQARERVSSYKEMPVNIKLRRS